MFLLIGLFKINEENLMKVHEKIIRINVKINLSILNEKLADSNIRRGYRKYWLQRATSCSYLKPKFPFTFLILTSFLPSLYNSALVPVNNAPLDYSVVFNLIKLFSMPDLNSYSYIESALTHCLRAMPII